MTKLNNNTAELDAVSVSSKQSAQEAATDVEVNDKPVLEALPEDVRGALVALQESKANLKLSLESNAEVFNSGSEEEGTEQKENVEEDNSNENTDEDVVKYGAHVTTVTNFLDEQAPDWFKNLEISKVGELEVTNAKEFFAANVQNAVEVITKLLRERNFDVQSILPQEET
ncbi:MAG: hypothetical protein VX335_01435, partial [Pseudomonadota bacterium]|nr:hypothetical protein [Pseudomonadota bacterium]